MAAPHRTLLETLGEPDASEAVVVVEAAPPCRVILANPAFSALTGYTPEEAVHQSVHNLLHGPLTCRETLSALGAAMKGTRDSHLPERARWRVGGASARQHVDG